MEEVIIRSKGGRIEIIPFMICLFIVIVIRYSIADTTSKSYWWELLDIIAASVLYRLYQTIKSGAVEPSTLTVTDKKIRIEKSVREVYEIYYADVSRFAYRIKRGQRMEKYFYVDIFYKNNNLTDGRKKKYVDYIYVNDWDYKPYEFYLMLDDRLVASRQ